MALDVESVSENLGTLIQLLDALGIDTSNSNEMDRVSKTLNKGDLTNLKTRNTLNDDQIEAIIQKLHQAQEQAPGIIAALESISAKNTRAHSSKKKKKKPKPKPKQQKEKKKPKPKQQKPQPPQQQVEEEEEDEDYDDFDEDADYPCVGEGYSDEISVISEMTTPTVVSKLDVADEERYQELQTPMKVIGTGGGPPMILQAPKRKNLVAQAASRAGGAGGAAAARRRNYQEAMAKLHENPYGMTMVGPQEAPPVMSNQVPMAAAKQLPRRSKSNPKNMINTEVAEDLGDWAAFDNTPTTPSVAGNDVARSKTLSPPKMKASAVSTKSGYMLDAEFDAFASKESPFATLDDSASAPSVASNSKGKKKKAKAKKGALASDM